MTTNTACTALEKSTPLPGAPSVTPSLVRLNGCRNSDFKKHLIEKIEGPVRPGPPPNFPLVHWTKYQEMCHLSQGLTWELGRSCLRILCQDFISRAGIGLISTREDPSLSQL
ncbi:hypothetical protein KIL84_003812 [Mauremys mutica]|uniref:Uncharacterized protein n=1 Tax=Mauremys mutica TaxID=74926 RepID=A0A9D4ARV9_9SAUR|nr:hypothetical protein KIL84_003812 [Mauremys mutica]